MLNFRILDQSMHKWVNSNDSSYFCPMRYSEFIKLLGIPDECGALESVKAASELFCPVSGKVVEKNIEVEGKPGLINTDCYATGRKGVF